MGSKPNRNKKFQVLLTHAELKKLHALAHEADTSGSSFLRRLVLNAHAMQHESQPSCASGAPCIMPALYFQTHPAKLPTQGTTAPAPPTAA